MTSELERNFSELNRKNWLETNALMLSDSMRGQVQKNDLADSVLKALSAIAEMQTGAFYVADGNRFILAGTYACENAPRVIVPGSGQLGQAIRDNKVKMINGAPPGYLRITSATGETEPQFVIITPLKYNSDVIGAIELGFLKKPSDLILQLLESVRETLGIGLNNSLTFTKMSELLEETQAQAEELQTQHSELENLNSELEAQAQKLQASEEELRVQQEELQQTNEELEERGSLLAERNIEVQKKAEELEQSTRYKSEFLANMSHELRTPLNSILLLSRLLFENHDKNLNDEEIEYARVIQNSGQGLLSLIDEILDLSKIEAGKMQVEFIDIDLAAFKDEINSLFQPVAREKELKFEVNSDKDLPSYIKSDKVRLGQIVKNLLSNALKFTTKGSVTLDITKHREKKGWMQFIVKDTGIGIPADKQQQIFEAFQQADGSTKRKFGGTGLGLSISRDLSKLLGGEIRVESAPGKGSTFTLVLPLNGEQQNEIADKEFTTAEPVLPVADQNGKTKDQYVVSSIPSAVNDDRTSIGEKDKVILIIEDDTPFAKVLLDFGHKQGYKVLVAVRGDEGLDLARRFRPLGILLDIQLPVKSGWQVMDELKSDPHTRHIPVHMMSSLKMKKESLMKGAVDFIDKPVALQGMQEMFQKIELVLSKQAKKVLIIEDNPQHAKALAYFLETFNITSELKKTVDDGLKALKSDDADCIILDMGVPDNKTYAMLEAAKKDPAMEKVPIIIFTGKSLNKNEEMKIKKYADSIVVKTAHSYQRMLDEVSIFLHMVEENKKGTRGNGSPGKLGELGQVLDGKTVLVVDDDVRNIFSLSKTLENYNMKVLTAIDGKEALEVMKQNPNLDVVLLDMMMPNMDGYETARRIREKQEWKHLPVIAVTAKAMVGDREKCISAGASDYITKPVDIDQLVSLLRVWLYKLG
jgi:signal transduction histidine kinase/CheY-like chemotaxis protein